MDDGFFELYGERKWQVAAPLDEGWYLVMEPKHDPIPVDSNGDLDWSRITAVTILGIMEHHQIAHCFAKEAWTVSPTQVRGNRQMKRKRVIVLVIKPKKRTGHVPRRSGAGVHQDRRTKRNRTRAAQTRTACQDHSWVIYHQITMIDKHKGDYVILKTFINLGHCDHH